MGAILLFDVMNTLVYDPIMKEVPAFFGLDLKSLFAQKSTHAWPAFERGEIDELEYGRRFFPDDRQLDIEGLKECMREAYRWMDGMEELLEQFKLMKQPMYIVSNYPLWYRLIETKLKLSRYLPWRFVSCNIGLRKPSTELYDYIVKDLGVKPQDLILVDDQPKNVEGARILGIEGIIYKSALQCQEELRALGVVT